MDINRLVSNMQEAAQSAIQTAAQGVASTTNAGNALALVRARDAFSFHESSPAEFSPAEAALAPEGGFPDPVSFLKALDKTLGTVMELLQAFSNAGGNSASDLLQFTNSLEGLLKDNGSMPGPQYEALRGLQGAVNDLSGLYQQTSGRALEHLNMGFPNRQSSSYSNQETHSYGQRFGPGSNLPAYGSRGTTIAEAQWGVTFAQANFQGQGDWGSAYFRGENFIGARARVFGDVNWDNRSMNVGFEAEIGARAHYEAGYRTPNAPVGAETAMATDAFAGAAASGTAELSLNENAPRVAVGAEMFEGARAGMDVGGGLGVDGNRIVGGHYGVEAWSGVGAAVHADLGFKDGNLRFDFSGGLALLIGAEVSFGIDIGFGDLFRSTTKLGEDVLKGLGKSSEAVAKEIGKAAETVAKDVAKTAGNAAKSAVDAAGKAAGDAGKAVAKVFDSIF